MDAYYNSYTSAEDSLAIVIILIALFAIFISFAVAIVTYIFTALSMQTIAKKRGIDKAFFAWIPVANSWLMGKIADDVNLCRRNKKTNFARNILILMIVFYAIYFFYFFCEFFSTFLAFSAPHSVSAVFGAIAILFSFIYFGVAIAQSVYAYMAMYRIYYGYAEEHATLYLVLSILVPISTPFLLFSIRNRELLPPDPTTFVQNGYPEYPDMYSANPVQTNENYSENNSNNGGQY